jgi:hypothetical protein
MSFCTEPTSWEKKDLVFRKVFIVMIYSLFDISYIYSSPISKQQALAAGFGKH